MIPILAMLLSALIGYGLLEFITLRRRCNEIPIRVYVNGTRGKSSVTRLIAAGLRAGGIRTVAKTTGSSAMLIFEDGSETPIPRIGPPRIAEQALVFRVAVNRAAAAVVVECMALQPYLQWLSAHKMVRPTVTVITNVRPDHLDVMGPTVDHVALALAGILTPKGTLITERSPYDGTFEIIANSCGATVLFVEPDQVKAVSDEEIARFSYLEHKANVAVALQVCQHLGVDRTTALNGMVSCIPDIGALRVFHLEFFGKSVRFANAFAANDPESNGMIWDMLRQRFSHLEPQTHILVINARDDRPQRSEQLGQWIARKTAHWYVLIGTDTRTVAEAALAAGADPGKVINLEDETPSAIFEEILNKIDQRGLVVGLGNIKGIGSDLVKYFENRSIHHD